LTNPASSAGRNTTKLTRARTTGTARCVIHRRGAEPAATACAGRVLARTAARFTRLIAGAGA